MKKTMITLLTLSILTVSMASCTKTCSVNSANPKCQESPPTDEVCQAAFSSWFYNASTNKCEELGYSGCQATGFETKQECEECLCNQ